MRGARVVGSLMLALLLARTCLAGKLLEREAAEVFAKMSVAAGQLTGMSGELNVHYAASDTFRRDHRARFWFSKPFRLRVDQLPEPGAADGIELYCAEQRASLYLPDRKQVVEFEIGAASAGDLLPSFFSLFTIPSFVQGALLPDVESQFSTQVEEVARGWRLTLTPHAVSFYRSALALDHITADVDRQTLLPYHLELHEESGGGSRQLCSIDLAKLQFNPRIAPHMFLYRPRLGVRRVASTEVLQEWVMDALGRAGFQGRGVMDGLQQKLLDFQKKPWDF